MLSDIVSLSLVGVRNGKHDIVPDVGNTPYITHTQASFNTMRYEGRDSASGEGRKLSSIRPGATTIVAP